MNIDLENKFARIYLRIKTWQYQQFFKLLLKEKMLENFVAKSKLQVNLDSLLDINNNLYII